MAPSTLVTSGGDGNACRTKLFGIRHCRGDFDSHHGRDCHGSSTRAERARYSGFTIACCPQQNLAFYQQSRELYFSGGVGDVFSSFTRSTADRQNHFTAHVDFPRTPSPFRQTAYSAAREVLSAIMVAVAALVSRSFPERSFGVRDDALPHPRRLERRVGFPGGAGLPPISPRSKEFGLLMHGAIVKSW